MAWPILLSTRSGDNINALRVVRLTGVGRERARDADYPYIAVGVPVMLMLKFISH